MAVKTIETRAVISAQDKTGGVFGQVVQKLKQMEDASHRASQRISAAAGATTAARRAEAAHLREIDKRNREIAAHGAVRYATGAAAAAVSAHSIAEVIRDTITAGSRYQHEIVALQNAGRTIEELAEIARASRETVAKIPTATYEENLKVINETTGAFGSLHHAIENLPFMQKSAAVLKSAAGDKLQIDAGTMGNQLARAFEERGTAGNTELFQKEAGEMVRAMVFTRGNFNPTEFLNFAQQAKSSLQNYDLRFLSKIVPSLVTVAGGERAGTAANAFTNVIMGKANDKKQAEAWMQYGLLDKSKAITKAGHAVSWTAGAVKETNLALSDPLEWSEKVLLPALKAHGVNTDDRLELAKVLGTMFRNQNANFFANELSQAQMRSRLHKDEGNINQAGDLGTMYARNLAEDPSAAIKALSASLDNLMTTVSSPAMKAAATGIESLAGGIQTLANALKDHPLLAMTGGALAAGGALAGAGTLAYKISTGFGLGASALALDESAAALTAAAAALGGSAPAKLATTALEAGLPTAAVAAGGAALAGTILGVGALAAGLGLGVYATDQNAKRLREQVEKDPRYTPRTPQEVLESQRQLKDVDRLLFQDQIAGRTTPDRLLQGQRDSLAGFVRRGNVALATTPIGSGRDMFGFGPAGTRAADPNFARPAESQRMTVSFDAATVKFEVTASSELLRVVSAARDVQLRPRSDIGSVGETTTNQ